MALPRIAYPHREHGVVIPDGYEVTETEVRYAVPDLDAGVLLHVVLLRHEGVQTIASCEGGSDHSTPFPWVEFAGGPGEGLRALGIAVKYNLPVALLSRRWEMRLGELMGPVWRLDFHATHVEAACDRPVGTSLTPALSLDGEVVPEEVRVFFRHHLQNVVYDVLIRTFRRLQDTDHMTKARLATRINREAAAVARWLSGSSNLTLNIVSDLFGELYL